MIGLRTAGTHSFLCARTATSNCTSADQIITLPTPDEHSHRPRRTDINLDRDTRSGAVDGARNDQSNITLDGIDVNNEGKGYAFTSVLPITLDSVEEFRVTTTNYSADQGRSSGAQVALVTKSGTNQYHGFLYEYDRNTATSANDYFIKLAELHDGEPNDPLKLIRNIFWRVSWRAVHQKRFFFFEVSRRSCGGTFGEPGIGSGSLAGLR